MAAKRELVKEGIWLYDKKSFRPVYIIRADSDFWYDKKVADDLLEENDKPELNAEGWMYYLCFKSHPSDTPQWVDSIGHKSLEEAVEHAESKFPAQIKWNELAISGDKANPLTRLTATDTEASEENRHLPTHTRSEPNN